MKYSYEWVNLILFVMLFAQAAIIPDTALLGAFLIVACMVLNLYASLRKQRHNGKV